MNYDTLLRWVSERGDGSLTAFRLAHDWLRSGEADASHWTWTLQSLQCLGHLEVDWEARRWEVAPSTIATVTSGGGYALLCGARPGWFLRRLDSLDSSPTLAHLAHSIILERPVLQDNGPSLRLVTLNEEKEAAEICEALGVQYSPFAADQLLHLLPSLPSLLVAGRRTEPGLPGGVLPTRMGDGEPGRPLFEEMRDPQDMRPGAYCMALFDTRRYFYVHSSDAIYQAGRGEVIYAELRRRGQQVLRWDQADQALLVPTRFRLPQLYERAAVLRTGLLPSVGNDVRPDSHATLFRYRNINLAFASLLGVQLGQEVEVVAGNPDPELRHPQRKTRVGGQQVTGASLSRRGDTARAAQRTTSKRSYGG